LCGALVIDTFYNLLFRCRHRRTSFPLRPPTKKGEPVGELRVVCLDCGKRFSYDWELMRIGPPSKDSPPPNAAPAKSRLRYLLAACALPAVWMIGKAARGRSKTQRKPL
jgi:hypothetical protein